MSNTSIESTEVLTKIFAARGRQSSNWCTEALGWRPKPDFKQIANSIKTFQTNRYVLKFITWTYI